MITAEVLVRGLKPKTSVHLESTSVANQRFGNSETKHRINSPKIFEYHRRDLWHDPRMTKVERVHPFVGGRGFGLITRTFILTICVSSVKTNFGHKR